jgi:hypothetical protein
MGGFKVSGMYLLVMKLDVVSPFIVSAKPVYPGGINGIIIGQVPSISQLSGLLVALNMIL